jgi:hypothetical protein
MRNGPCRIEMAAAIRERVRRDIQDAHDERAFEGEAEFSAMKLRGHKNKAGSVVPIRLSSLDTA